MTPVGVVVIGRNEGERLERCFASLRAFSSSVVYVDSGSSDGSVACARRYGFEVIELDMTTPFTAARARNEGAARLREVHAHVSFLQFIDGDCEMQPEWLPAATAALERDALLAIVCGRRREAFPERSVYNRLCDIEWETPIGRATACGGDFLARRSVFEEVGGFDPSLIAGEEPELCYRIRRHGFAIERLDVEMTRHDAAMTRLSEWWRRTRRAGYAYALVSALHAREPERIWSREVLSITAWAFWPVAVGLAAWFIHPALLLGWLAYPLLVVKIFRYLRVSRGLPASQAWPYAVSCVAAKPVQFGGVVRCYRDLLLGRRRALIEYK